MFVHVYIHHFDKLTATGAVSAREEGGGRREEGEGGERREEEGGGGGRQYARVHTCSKPCADQSLVPSLSPKTEGESLVSIHM